MRGKTIKELNILVKLKFKLILVKVGEVNFGEIR